MAEHVHAFRAVHLECAVRELSPPLIAAAVAIPDHELCPVRLTLTRHVETATRAHADKRRGGRWRWPADGCDSQVIELSRRSLTRAEADLPGAYSRVGKRDDCRTVNLTCNGRAREGQCQVVP